MTVPSVEQHRSKSCGYSCACLIYIFLESYFSTAVVTTTITTTTTTTLPELIPDAEIIQMFKKKSGRHKKETSEGKGMVDSMDSSHSIEIISDIIVVISLNTNNLVH